MQLGLLVCIKIRSIVLFSHIVCQPSWHCRPERLQNSTWQEILNGKTNKTSRCNENLSFCPKMPSHRKINAITRVNIVLRRTKQLCTEHTWKENFELQTRNFSQKFHKNLWKLLLDRWKAIPNAFLRRFAFCVLNSCACKSSHVYESSPQAA